MLVSEGSSKGRFPWVEGSVCCYLPGADAALGHPNSLDALLAQINVKCAPHGGYKGSYGGWEAEMG